MKHLLVAIACLSLSSCAGVVQGSHRSPISGAVYDSEGVHVDQKTIGTLFSKLGRLAAGEDVLDVILDPLK